MTSSLLGTWELLCAELGGDAAPDLLALRIELQLTADTYVVTFDGTVADRGTYTHGPDLPHKSLIVVGLEGPNQGRTIPSIYQLVGDRLRICYGFAGTLPASFATTAGTPLYMATYRRKAP